MRAIILAAGRGTRLGQYGQDKPKGMLEFDGKPLLAHQIETLRKGGVEDIVIVRGYRAEMINFPGVRYIENPDFADTNMVHSLFCARQWMNEDFLVCYSDILYEPHVLRAILSSPASIGVTVDMDFFPYWKARLEKPEEDHESLSLAGDTITELGEPDPPQHRLHARYVGLLKFSGVGREEMQRVYDEQRKQWEGRDERWLRSKSFRKGQMTDLLQAIIDAKLVPVTAVRVEHGWLEFDTAQDYERYQEWMADGTMRRFFAF